MILQRLSAGEALVDHRGNQHISLQRYCLFSLCCFAFLLPHSRFLGPPPIKASTPQPLSQALLSGEITPPNFLEEF